MPRVSERQELTEALAAAYVAQRRAEADMEMDLFMQSSDSSSISLGSDRSLSTQSTTTEHGSDVSMHTTGSLSDDNDLPDLVPEFSQRILETLTELHSKRYLHDRGEINKTNVNMAMLLNDYKFSQPAIFRQYLRITPACFDALLAAISNNPIFFNDSPNEQISVEVQLAVALYRFGHYGNGASILEVAIWAGIGYGSVDLVTRRVIHAMCDDEFRTGAIRWPTAAEIEASRKWVEDRSCTEWRGGWLMVDGTLVPLYQRPGFFGNSWFDRKSNYSMNVQVSIGILHFGRF